MWVLRTVPRSSARAATVLAAEPSLKPMLLLFFFFEVASVDKRTWRFSRQKESVIRESSLYYPSMILLEKRVGWVIGQGGPLTLSYKAF